MVVIHVNWVRKLDADAPSKLLLDPLCSYCSETKNGSQYDDSVGVACGGKASLGSHDDTVYMTIEKAQKRAYGFL
jgi:hypothetical protein